MPSKLNTFKNLFLNIRVEAHDPFVSREIWVKNYVPNVLPSSLYGKMAFVGIDLSGGRDLCALSVVVPDISPSSEEGAQHIMYHAISYFWKPEGMMEESELQDKVPYRQWVSEGHLRQTYGNSIDMEYIARALMEVCEDFKVVTIGVDRWKQKDLERELKKIGFNGELTPIGQGFKDFGPCVQIMESVLYNGELNHFNNPILMWNARNAVVEMDAAGSKKLTKVKSFGRIDGMIAMAMALRCWEMFKNENPNYASFNSSSSLYLNDEIYKMME
jgi:phage terminase large subunit-like protein